MTFPDHASLLLSDRVYFWLIEMANRLFLFFVLVLCVFSVIEKAKHFFRVLVLCVIWVIEIANRLFLFLGLLLVVFLCVTDCACLLVTGTTNRLFLSVSVVLFPCVADYVVSS